MRTFFRVVLLLAVLISLALGFAYLACKDLLIDRAHHLIERQLSVLLQHPVRIGSVRFIPFRSVSIDRVTVLPPDGRGAPVAGADNITVTVDVLSLVKDKRLKGTIAANGLRSGDLFFDAAILFSLHRADNYRDIFDISAADLPSFMKALTMTKNLISRDIFGHPETPRAAAPTGRSVPARTGAKYLVEFTARPGEANRYDISVRSDNLDLRSPVIMGNGRLALDRLTGKFHDLRFNLAGELRYRPPAEAACSISGTVEANLENFAGLPGKIGEFARAHSMSGTVRSRVFFSAEGPAPGRSELSSTIHAGDLRIAKLRIKKIHAKLSLQRGKLSAPVIGGKLYGGSFDSALQTDFTKKDVPYVLGLAISGMDLGSFMRDMSGDKIKVHGTLDADLSLKGYAAALETAEGMCAIAIADADLGPMPILTPLLGNIFSAARNVLPGTEKLRISRAYADLDIKDRKVMTDNLTCWGDDIAITGEGHMDFDGRLDLECQNHLVTGADMERKAAWGIPLKGAIIQFGKLISKAHLRGTVTAPKWEFEYIDPLKKLLHRNITGLVDISE